MVSIKERELIIYHRKKGRSVSEISEILDLKRSSVGFWVKRYNSSNSLNNLPKSGRPTILSKNFLDSISYELRNKLLKQNKNEKSGFNSKEVLEIIKQKTGKKYSLRHIQRILHKIGFSLITPRVNHLKKDPVAINNFREEFKKKLPRNIWGIQ